MNKNTLIITACLLVLFGIVVRLFPHTPNMTPITAIAFIGGLYLGRKWAIVLPLLVLLASDLFIGFYDWQIMLAVYGSFATIGLLGFVATKYRNIFPIGLSVVGSSVLFFLITNAAVWAFSPWYAKTVSGLLYSYELGLPFLKNMLLGDVVYMAVLAGVFEGVRLLRTSTRLLQHSISKTAEANGVASMPLLD